MFVRFARVRATVAAAAIAVEHLTAFRQYAKEGVELARRPPTFYKEINVKYYCVRINVTSTEEYLVAADDINAASLIAGDLDPRNANDADAIMTSEHQSTSTDISEVDSVVWEDEKAKRGNT